MTDVIIEEEIRIERERRERARVRVKMEGRRERVRGEERGRKRRGGGERERERERKRERIDMCIQIESHVKVSEGAMYKSRREAPNCNQSCQHLDLGLLSSRAMRK